MLKEFLWLLLFALLGVFAVIFAIEHHIILMFVALFLGFVFYELKHINIED